MAIAPHLLLTLIDFIIGTTGWMIGSSGNFSAQ
jgi:hypothetical protein